MKPYYNIIIQFLNLFNALIPNLVYPVIFGLAYHGNFLALIAIPTFIIYLVSLPYDTLLLKEMAARPKLGLDQGFKILLWQKLVLANLSFILFYSFYPSGNLFLQLGFLNSAGLSSFMVSALYADNQKPSITLFLIAFVITSLIAALLTFHFGQPASLLVIAVIAINLGGALGAAWFLKHRLVGTEQLEIHPLRILNFIGLTSAIGTLSYGIVALATLFLTPTRLSLLRIAISVAQAATTFFPVNQRTILENIVRLKEKEQGLKAITNYLIAALSLIAMMALAVATGLSGLFILSSFKMLPSFLVILIAEYRYEFLVISPAISLFLLASILEKFIIGLLPERQGLLYGLGATLLIIIGSVMAMTFMPIGGFTAYSLSAINIVAVASLSLTFANKTFLKPLFVLTSLILTLTILTFWGATNSLAAIVTFMILLAATGIISFYLWRVQYHNILNFIKR